MWTLEQSCRDSFVSLSLEFQNLSLESTLQELSLYDFQLESAVLGKEVAQTFELNPLLPGVILTEEGVFTGIISRRRFLERMSRPYGLELFLRRPLKSLYRFAQSETLILSGNTPIDVAACYCLKRRPELIYEPIAVEWMPQTYRLLDTYQLLVAQLHIHKLATQLLSEFYHKLEVANLQLEQLATSDGLTGIANRRRFDNYLQACWQQQIGGNSWLSLIMCDVDFFKSYNDTYGHQAGDRCLQQIVVALGRVVKRREDLVARYGGEEFAVILPQTPLDGACRVAETIRQEVRALEIPHAKSLGCGCVTLSLGVASMMPTPEVLPTRLTAAADIALYQAKSLGRDRVIIHLPAS